MILHNLVTGTRADVMVTPALAVLGAGPYYTSDFIGCDGRAVIVFWTVDNTGSVAMVWEHTMAHLSALTPTGEVRYMIP